MVIGQAVENLSDIIGTLPPQIIDNISWLIVIFKAAGIAFIVYILYLVVMGILTFKRIKRMKNIEKKVLSIDKKLDLLLKEKNRKKKK